MKVLNAIDSSPASQRVLEEVAARPWPSNTAFCIVSAVEVHRFSELPALAADAQRECEQLVKTGAAKLLYARQTATTQVLMGSPRKAVSTYAQDWGADLIIAGSHGHSAVGRGHPKNGVVLGRDRVLSRRQPGPFFTSDESLVGNRRK